MKQIDTNPVKRNMDKMHKPANHRDKKKDAKRGYVKNGNNAY